MPDGRDMIFMSMSNGLLSFYATFFVTSWRHDVVIIVIVRNYLRSYGTFRREVVMNGRRRKVIP